MTYEVREESAWHAALEEGLYAFSLEQADGRSIQRPNSAGPGWNLDARFHEQRHEEEAASRGKFAETLGHGEASCLALAQERGWLILTDDLRARRMARRLGLDVTGTLGILALAVEEGILDLAAGDQLLNQMIAEGYRSPYGSLTELLPGWLRPHATAHTDANRVVTA